MIPRHRPPIGPLSLAGLGIRSLFVRQDVRALERDCAEHLRVADAVWLPSARYGITRSIQLVTSQDATVFCPVFNCGAVHHAASETGRTVELVDNAPDSFLIDGTFRPARSSSEHAIILSEMFGHRFSSDALQQPLFASATLRVFDMAMAIPVAADLERLVDSDVAVVSFGLGKSLYAGWGGMAFTHNVDLARDLRNCRDQDLSEMGIAAQLKSFVKMLARTAAHEPFIYGHLRRIKNSGDVETGASFTGTSHEWHRPHTPLHLAMADRNFSMTAQSIDRRVELADIYRRNLPSDVVPAETSIAGAAALSHFSIRVAAAVREMVRAKLWDAGIDVGTLFPFPSYLAATDAFPNASMAASEVLNLPLSCQLRRADIERICLHVERSLSEVACCTAERPRPVAA